MDKDKYTNSLIERNSKGLLNEKEQAVLAEYLNAVGVQLQLRGVSEADAQKQIAEILKETSHFSPNLDKQYNQALSQLSTQARQEWQAMIGTDALLAGPGRVSQIMRLALISGGSYQTGTGLAQIADGKIAEGSINVGLGSAAVSGGYLGNKVTTGKPNGGIVSPGNSVWQENTLVKYPYYDKPQQGGTLNIGAGNKPIEGAYNISHPDYPKGIGVYANNLSNVATSSQKTVIMENPYGFKPFNEEVLRVLDKNGTVVVTGSWNNPAMKNIEKEAKKNGFKLVEVKTISSDGFKDSNGKPINNPTVKEYKFERE
ncbi:hypothetical protein ACJ5XU_002622 [Providencia stuartii]